MNGSWVGGDQMTMVSPLVRSGDGSHRESAYPIGQYPLPSRREIEVLALRCIKGMDHLFLLYSRRLRACIIA